MKQVSIARAVMGVLLLAVGPGQALAQNCTGTSLSSSDITTLVSGKYACVGASPNATWNELHTGGKVLDYKMGPGSADPSDTTAHPTGSYAVSGGVITYTYGSRHYAYVIKDNLTHPQYSFCGSGGNGGPNMAVTISTNHC